MLVRERSTIVVAADTSKRNNARVNKAKVGRHLVVRTRRLVGL